MRPDLLVCALGFLTLPLLGAWLLLGLRRRHGLDNAGEQRLVAVLAAAVAGWPLGMVSWILLALVGGFLLGLLQGDAAAGLRGGLQMAVPLTEREELRPWGLLPPLLTALGMELVLVLLYRRHLRRTA